LVDLIGWCLSNLTERIKRGRIGEFQKSKILNQIVFYLIYSEAFEKQYYGLNIIHNYTISSPDEASDKIS
jgi:hypothetical protein